MAAALVLAQLKAQMAQPGYARSPSLGLLYITDHYDADARELLAFMEQELPDVKGWSGTVGVGVAGNNVEYFDEPALSVMLCDLPPDQWRIFSGIAPPPRAGSGDWETRFALVHADQETPDLIEVLYELASRTTSQYLFGGLSASRGAHVQFALDRLRNIGRKVHADEDDSGVLRGGLSGVAFSPAVQWVSRVTHGCRPIGPWSIVTAVHENLVLELDGVPALDVLLETLNVSLQGDTQLAIEAVRATQAGLLDVGQPEPRSAGFLNAATRVRHIVGLDATRRGVALAESVEPGSLLAFCQRNTKAARADLMRVCAEIREELSPVEDFLPAHGNAPDPDLLPDQWSTSRQILGAVYVSCSARGGLFFGGANAEMQIVRRALGDVPLTGFFAGGEIAAHRLCGYTGVLTVFVDDVPVP